MPRPTTKLTDDQRRLLEVAVEEVQRARRADEVAWGAALTARKAGVPDEMICDETGLSRSTFYRRFGPREKGES